MTGPIPISAFMRQVLTSPDGGYYTTRPDGGEVFGKKGDFITSPEISQVFGELVGVWTIAEWIAQGRKRSGVQLMEVGPGKGTLMDDLMRVSGCFFFLGLGGEYAGLTGVWTDVSQFQGFYVEHRGDLSGRG